MASGHFHYIVRHGDIDAFSHGKLVVSKEVIQAAIREQILTLNTCPSVCTGVYTEICKHVSATYMKHCKYKCERSVVWISKDALTPVVCAPDHQRGRGR